jgi:hypothetical protein
MVLKKNPVTSEMKMWINETKSGQTQVRIALEGKFLERRKK